MSDLLSIGASGARAYQTALSVTGENIANAQTPGYVRREATLKEIHGGPGNILGTIDRTTLGGVNATGVSRQWDVFRAAEVRRGTADAAGTEAAIPWMERIESALDKGGLAGGLNGFFNAATALAGDPTGLGARTTMLEAGNVAAGAFRATATGLSAIAKDLEQDTQSTVATFNRLAAGLAEANSGILRARPGSNGQAQLMDQRDKLLDEMSALASIAVKIGADGTAKVSLNERNGPVLVDRAGAATISATSNGGVVAFALHRAGTRDAIQPRGGALGGLGDAAARTAAAIAEVDRIAAGFAADVNAVQANGADQDGMTGTALFDATGGAATFAMVATGPRAIAAAGRWTVAPQAGNSGAGRIATRSDPLATDPVPAPLRFEIADGELVAFDPVTNTELERAAILPGEPVAIAGLLVTITGAPAVGDRFGVTRTAAGSRDNSNLSGLAALRGDGGAERATASLVTTNATALAARRTVAEAQVAIRDGAIANRDNVSGVNLDEEAIDLLRFQQAYSASSRIIQVARETFQTLLDAS